MGISPDPGASPAPCGDAGQRAERAEAALRAKSELVAIIGHELRTPMGAIISMADLLLGTPLDETQRRYAHTLQQSARSLLGLLDDVLDNEQLEAGRFPFEPRPIALGEFLNSVETSLLARAGTAGIEARLERESPLPAEISADPLRLRQILDNLIDNAVKFTKRGEVCVSARYEASSERLVIAVRDTGIGMSAEDCRRLFEPYVRGAEAQKASYRGTGLGLSIVAKLVALMDGGIACDSALRKGSTFTVSLSCPTVAPAGAEAAARAGGQGATRLRPRGPLRALVVEDNEINQTLIGAFLETFGMEGRMVDGGDEALAALAEESFDVVLMDLRMAGMDGIETTQRIRALDGAPARTPIIAITAQAHAADRARVFAAGMDGYVSKPIDPRALYSEILSATGTAPAVRTDAG